MTNKQRGTDSRSPEVAAATTPEAEQTVTVRRQWNDSRQLTIPLAGLTGLHRSSVSGGIRARANQSYLHGYMSCDLIPHGAEFGHSCEHGPPPHRIKVCVVKKDNTPSMMKKLASRAAE
jgi:hypothetical protein